MLCKKLFLFTCMLSLSIGLNGDPAEPNKKTARPSFNERVFNTLLLVSTVTTLGILIARLSFEKEDKHVPVVSAPVFTGHNNMSFSDGPGGKKGAKGDDGEVWYDC